MEFESISHKRNEYINGTSDMKESISKYLKHYKWFILSAIVFFLIALIYVQFQIPQYRIETTLLIKESEKGKSITDLSSFENAGLIGSGENILENEIQILQSRRLMTKVVQELELNIKYFIEDSPYDRELYPTSPIFIVFDPEIGTIEDLSASFEIIIKSESQFEINTLNNHPNSVHDFDKEFAIKLGEEDFISKGKLTIFVNDSFTPDLIEKKIIVNIATVNGIVSNYLDQIVIEPINDQYSNVIAISLTDSKKNKGIMILNNLIEQYNADRINDENLISQNTTKFLDDRVDLIIKELIAIEETAEQYKTQNLMLNEKEGTEYYLESSSQNENQAIAVNTQMQLVNYVLDELSNSAANELLPVNIGLSDLDLVKLIGEYNSIVLRRARILKSSSERNPIVVNLSSQLEGLKDNIYSSLRSLKSSLQIQINALKQQGGIINTKIASAPKNEREYNNIVRKLETKNKLYLFLLQKREESILANAVRFEKAKVINEAYSEDMPISPKKKIIYLAAILLGLFFPASIIYLNDLMNTKLQDSSDFEFSKIPYLGDIPLNKDQKNQFVKDGDSSKIAEAFRYIRTNVNFLLDEKQNGKTIFVTSTESDEGKTFVSINLATSLAISGKKTLLIGLDLRASKIPKLLDIEDILGVSNFVKNKDLSLDAITEKFYDVDNLDIINSGDSPPNPVELLMDPRLNEIFKEVKTKYEYIIVDTAPVGLVTDTIQVGKFADLTIYVVKANHLDKGMLRIPERLNSEKKLFNMSYLLNGTELSRNSYGYGYGQEKRKAWYKIK